MAAQGLAAGSFADPVAVRIYLYLRLSYRRLSRTRYYMLRCGADRSCERRYVDAFAVSQLAGPHFKVQVGVTQPAPPIQGLYILSFSGETGTLRYSAGLKD